MRPSDIRVELRHVSLENFLARIYFPEANTEKAISGRAETRRTSGQIHECSNVIESILVRIPLPAIPVQVVETENGYGWRVVSKLKLALALEDFIINESYQLQQMIFFPELSGKKFHELPRNYQRRILETNLYLHVIEHASKEATFEMINRTIIMHGM